jgi:uncharacterized protein (TIGR00730 family)
MKLVAAAAVVTVLKKFLREDFEISICIDLGGACIKQYTEVLWLYASLSPNHCAFVGRTIPGRACGLGYITLSSTMPKFRSICVYCGSRAGANPVYRQAALDLADHFVEHGIRMVNGGGSIGLMGAMSDRIISRGGEAVGVIPEALVEKEVAHEGMTDLVVVQDMHSRKLTMVNISDAFIALPGGYGTLDETFETLTWLQLRFHLKPIGMLNVNGYFDHLLAMLDHMVEEGFLKADTRTLLHAHAEIDTLLQQLAPPPRISSEKWE